MSKNIFDLHNKAFQYVSAMVFVKENQQLRVSFKFPNDGAGRLWCYVHLVGFEMVRGFAGGYGYDKKTAAFCNALEKLQGDNPLIPELKQAFEKIGGADFTDYFYKNSWQKYQVL